MKRFALGLGLALAVVPVYAQQAPQGPRAIMGRVTAKADKSLDVQAFQRGQGGQGQQVQMKVNLTDDTKLGKLEQGAAADLTEGYVVAVAGAKDGAKVTATGALRLNKGEVDEGTRTIAMAAARMLRGRQQGGQGQRPQPPVVGVVSSTNPLKVKTADGEVEVTFGENPRLMKLSEAKVDDIAANGFVIVVPTAEAQDNTVTARAVLVAPNRSGRRGGNGGGN